MPTNRDASRLARRYRRLVWAFGTAVILILAVLIAREYSVQIDRSLELRTRIVRERLASIEGIVQAADGHVTGMRSTIVRALSDPRTPSVTPEIRALTERLENEPVDLFGPPGASDRGSLGVLMAVPSRARLQPAFLQEAVASASLFPIQAAAHSGHEFLKWSYFFSESRSLISIYPWLDFALATPAGENPLDTFDSFYAYDVYRLAAPPANTSEDAVWVPVYVDAGLAGVIVSRNAPVIVNGRLRGMVGTDVLVKSLSDRLAGSELSDTFIVVVDQAGSVVADNRGISAAKATLTAAADLLPAGVDDILVGRYDRFGDTYAKALPVAGTPWVAVTVVPVRAVSVEAAAGVLPYLVYLVVLTGALTAAFLAIGRQFVQPAFELVRTIERQASGAPVTMVDVPPAWRPWTERVLAVFGDLHHAFDRAVLAETKSAAIIDVALDAVVTTGPDGRVVDFNPAAERIFGYSRDEAIGRSIGQLIVPHHLRDAHEAGMERYNRSRVSHVLGRRIELQALHASGRVFPVEIQIHELAAGGDVAYAAYIRDLTDQRAAAAALKDQQEKLHQAEKLTAMGSLLAGLAHELNNPLAVVTAQTSLLEEIATDPPIRARAAKIRAAAERCGRIVRTFLTMARKQTPQRRGMDVRTVIDSALDILAYGLRSNGVTVTKNFAAHVPPVHADPDQLGQVFVNMIVNAQQAFGDRPGDRFIRLVVEQRGYDIAVVIEDNGPGVPDGLKSQVFDAFFTTKPVGVGTGIGLSVCRSIVEAHGGRIDVSDREGGGACFTITLPVAEASATNAVVDPIHMPASDGRTLSVLVIDDEHEVADSLAGFLELDGVSVTCVHTIADGLNAAATAPFDAVFCDLRMPGGGGTALWAEIARRDPGLADRFIFVTGDMVAGPETLRAAAAGRTVRMLEKPFDRAGVRAALSVVAPRHEREGNLA